MTSPDHRPLRSTAHADDRRAAVLDLARRPFPAVAFLAGAVITLIVATPASSPHPSPTVSFETTARIRPSSSAVAFPSGPTSASESVTAPTTTGTSATTTGTGTTSGTTADRITGQPVGDEAPFDDADAGNDDAPARMNAFEYVLGPAPMRVIRDRIARVTVAALRDAPATSTLDDDRNLVRAAVESEIDRIAETWHLVSPGRVWSDGDRIIGRGLGGPQLARMKVAAGTKGPRLCDDDEADGGGAGGVANDSDGAALDGRENVPDDAAQSDDENDGPTLIEVLTDAAADGAEDSVDATQDRRDDRAAMIDAFEEKIVKAIRKREDNTSCRRFQDCGYFVYDERLQCWYDLECDPNDYGASSGDGVTSDPAAPRCRPSDPDGDGKPG